MDPKKFYGGIHTIIPHFPDDSTDENLSNDDNYARLVRSRPPIFVPESEESASDPEDNIPLSEIPSTSSRAARSAKPKWRNGSLVETERNIEFSGDTNLPAHIMQFETPVQFELQTFL